MTARLPVFSLGVVATFVHQRLLSMDLHVGWVRPQYIYGPLTNKRDYLDWFFDRVVHGIEVVPIPLHGDQLVTLTHAEDVASMLASVVGNENAVNQVRNERRFPLGAIVPEIAR